MKTLTSLVILGDQRFRDYFTETFLYWVRIIQGGRFHLERLWTTEEEYELYSSPTGVSSLVELMDGPIVKSFAMPKECWDDENVITLNQEERFKSLEHLAEIDVYYRDIEPFENLTELKYIRGECDVEVNIIIFIVFYLK